MTRQRRSWRKDLFDQLIQPVRLESSIYFRPQLRAPWGFGLSDGADTVFHIVARGRCWLEVKGLPKPLRLSRGDFVVLPHGRQHSMRSAPAAPVVDFFDLVRTSAPDKNGVFFAGGKGPVTALVCGGMRFPDPTRDPLLAILPPLIHVKRRNARSSRWLRATMTHILDELDARRAGAEVVVTRLGDILFIQAVRVYLEDNIDRAQSGWLAGARDRHVGRVLALLHGQPAEAWTIGLLARELAISRSTLAEKFVRLIGEPPHLYLTRLRLHTAATRLSSSEDKLKAVAAAAGYASVAAFARAFKQHMGVTPGQYRRSHGSSPQARIRAGSPSEARRTIRK